MRPAGFSTGNPKLAKLSPSAPPVPAGKWPASFWCKRNSTQTETKVATNPPTRTAAQDQAWAGGRSTRPAGRSNSNAAAPRPVGRRYAPQPNANSAMSAVYAPLRPTQLDTARSVPSKDQAGSIAEYETMASSM